MCKKSHFKNKICLGILLFAGFSAFAQTPYNVVMNIYQDPTTQMAFNWFTDNAKACGKVEIVTGIASNHAAFANPFKSVSAACTENNTINKAVVTGLAPNTTYSFRVGGVNGNWSNIGTFTTAKANKEPFSFLYLTDSQVGDSNFDLLQTNGNAAVSNCPNANFWLHCGDLAKVSEPFILI